MDMTVMMHDNRIYGLTKMQVSPTTPKGQKSNTSPRGAYLDPLNPLSATLGISNVSFVAQAVDWIPELSYSIISQAFQHKGLSFITILQRCPNYLPVLFDPFIEDPNRTLILHHENGIQLDPSLARVYKNHEEHDPSDLSRARDIASNTAIAPVGILYRNDDVPCYEDVRRRDVAQTPEMIEQALNDEFDNFTVEPVL
jgi:2-oxoglutarate ferredoxin oxidoreductase subunit beta